MKNPAPVLTIAAVALNLISLSVGSSQAAEADQADRRQPNIVFMMCDDLGFGDIHCMAPDTCKIATPGADTLARQGMIFTDAHSGSSVCTPTRYGLMTGRYSWRTRLQKGVVTGFAPSLIAADRPTVASFLRDAGYHTAIVGKWHLDFLYQDPKSGEAYSQKKNRLPPVGAVIPDGPIHRGFDYFHGFHHARNMEAVIEDSQVIEHDATVNMLPRLTRKSVQYIESRAKEPTKPFFLYIPLGSPHTPIVPSKEWKGKSGLGDYGDFVMQTDNALVEVTAALQRHGMADNTLVIFTSDNGCSRAAGIAGLKKQGHIVSGPLRGSKADIWDGGHRVPFIVRWPGIVEPASTNDTTICLTDFFATVGDIIDRDVPQNSCEDSVSFQDALHSELTDTTNTASTPQRAGIVHHSFSGHFAYRLGDWKIVLARGSGGWSSPNEKQSAKQPAAQLYNMATDLAESQNLIDAKPEIANRLLRQLESDVNNGRSTSGPASTNDVDEIKLWKSGKAGS